MAIKFYDHGDHGSGFVGYRVAVALGGNHRTEYFSTSPAKKQDLSDPYVRYQHLKAQMKNTEWEAEELLDDYRLFVSEDDPKALPHQGVGCHGILCDFFETKWGTWQSGFRVRRKAGRATRFIFDTTPFSKAWSDAVIFWQSLHGIEQEDVKRLLKSPPEPSQFKALRRYLNDHLKADIPVETLTPIFAEQREALAQKKALDKAHQMKLSAGLKVPRREEVEADMLSWFESETS